MFYLIVCLIETSLLIYSDDNDDDNDEGMEQDIIRSKIINIIHKPWTKQEIFNINFNSPCTDRLSTMPPRSLFQVY